MLLINIWGIILPTYPTQDVLISISGIRIPIYSTQYVTAQDLMNKDTPGYSIEVLLVGGSYHPVLGQPD